MTLPIRFCPVCEQADDAPRHDPGFGDPRVVPHMDCCAAAGCPDGSCPIVLQVLPDGVKDDELRAAIVDTDNQAAIVELLEDRDDETRHYEHQGDPTVVTSLGSPA